ncbi:MAG: PepSY-like domain-containing protein [Saprospiraceae bacterium]|nr:PepSY-like domain-containing protein [Saprospiraceae bacterium]
MTILQMKPQKRMISKYKHPLFIALLVFFVSSLGLAQDVPAAVSQSFKNNYPNAEVIEWEAYEGNYTASFFNTKEQYCTALFEADGDWISSNTQIAESGLPSKVKNCWQKKYPEIRSVSAILKTERPGKKPQYQISFETNELLVNLVFNHKGKIKKKLEEPIATDN